MATKKLTTIMAKPHLLKRGIKGTKLPDGRVGPKSVNAGIIRGVLLNHQDAMEYEAKLRLLCEREKVNYGDWLDLAFKLAIKHEPSFRLVAPAGRPPGNPWVWDKEKDAKLVRDIDNLLASGMKVRPACRHLVERSSAYQGAKAEALRSRYRSLKDRA